MRTHIRLVCCLCDGGQIIAAGSSFRVSRIVYGLAAHSISSNHTLIIRETSSLWRRHSSLRACWRRVRYFCRSDAAGASCATLRSSFFRTSAAISHLFLRFQSIAITRVQNPHPCYPLTFSCSRLGRRMIVLYLGTHEASRTEANAHILQATQGTAMSFRAIVLPRNKQRLIPIVRILSDLLPSPFDISLGVVSVSEAIALTEKSPVVQHLLQSVSHWNQVI